MAQHFELNDDVLDVLQEKIDNLLEVAQDADMDDDTSYDLFDVEDEWGSAGHQAFTVNIARRLITRWSLFDPSFHYDLSTLVTIEQFYVAFAAKGLSKRIFSDCEDAPIEYLEYHLLNFITAEIQMAAIIAKKKSGSNVESTEANDHRNRIAFQLDKICKLLKIEISDITSTEQVVQKIFSAASKFQSEHPTVDIHNMPKLLPGLSMQSISLEQQEKLREIENAFYQDFMIRRQMLLKRLEVTLNSFLGEDRAKSSGDENLDRLRTAILSQQKYLETAPLHYQLEDALNAPLSLAIEQTMKVTGEMNVGEKSLVKKVIVGNVPDRGGRVNELRQKRLDGPPSQKHGQGGFNKGGHNFGKGRKNIEKGNGSDGKDEHGSSGGRVVVVTEGNKSSSSNNDVNNTNSGGVNGRKSDSNPPNRKKERR